ncbi:MAG: Protease 3 precursor [Pseudomonadota bacterium]
MLSLFRSQSRSGLLRSQSRSGLLHSTSRPGQLRAQAVTLLRAGALILLCSGSLAQQIPRSELPTEAFTLPLDAEIPSEPRIIKGSFANGLRYFIRESDEPANRAELRFVVNAGSVLETDTQVGLAHFLEHMAFNGSEHFQKQQLIGYMQSIGMQIGAGVNAHTSFDETVYELEVPTGNPVYMETAFQIMQDWATGLTLDPAEVELERGVVIEEWRQSQGAQTRIMNEQMPVLLKDSRYAVRLPIGTPENLRSFDIEELRSFYRDWYRPDLIGVVAAGDFKAADIEALMRKYFETIPAAENPKERTVYTIPPHAETEFVVSSDPEVPVTQLTVTYKKPAFEDWTLQRYKQWITEQLFDAMLNARLQELTRQPDSPFLNAGSGASSPVRPLSTYMLFAAVQEGGVPKALEALLLEAERVTQFGFSAAELERNKTATMRFWDQQYNERENRNSTSHAEELIRAFLTGEVTPGAAWEYALNARFLPEITLDEINAFARSWLGPENRVVAVTSPRKPGLVLPTAEELSAVVASVAGAEVSAREEILSDADLLPAVPQGSPVVSTQMLEGGLTEWVLGNGVRVILKPTDFRQDEILFAAVSKGGTSLASDADYIAASTAVSIIANGGVGDFNAIDLQRKLTGKLVGVAPYISEFEEGLRGGGSPADLETLMQLTYLRMTAPRADATAFEIFRTQTRIALQNRSADPATVFEDSFGRLLYQDHLRRSPPTAETIEQADLDKSLRFYQERFGDASDFTFIFVGTIDPEVLQPLVETYLGGLPAAGRQESWRDTGVRTPTGVVEETLRRGLEPQAQTRIAFLGDFPVRDNYARARLTSVVQALQGRLNSVLREQLGGTYGVQVAPQMSFQPTETAGVVITFGSAPERVDELLAALFAEIERFKEFGPYPAEMADARQYYLRTQETSIEQNGYWLAQLAQAVSMDLEPLARDILEQPTVIDLTTPEEVRETARQLLDPANYVRLTMLPEN